MGDRCPAGFQLASASGSSCVIQCPSIKGFENGEINGTPACLYSDDKTVTLNLTPIPAVQVAQGQPTPTMSQLQATDPSLYATYAAELERFSQKFPVVESSINKETALSNAFKSLQLAENSRDQTPEAYQTARSRYYTLLKGDTWLTEERGRIAKVDVEPIVTKYNNMFTDLTNRSLRQQQTMDVVGGVKDKLLSMKDDIKYSVDTFSKNINDLKSKLTLERRLRSDTTVDPWKWVDTILNGLVIIALIAAAFLFYRKLTPATPTDAETPVETAIDTFMKSLPTFAMPAFIINAKPAVQNLPGNK